MKLLVKLILFSAFSLHLFAQENKRQPMEFIFLPNGINFAPLKAHINEPRIGVFKFLDDSKMKVDIGNTIDVFGLSIPDSRSKFTAGIDFFAYAYTTGAQGLRLQIDALDGFFGGNLSFSKYFDEETIQARLRILHHSAHFVDGHYNLNTNSWLDNREPIPFTRDFGELVLAHRIDRANRAARYYAGLSYATLARPAIVKRFAYLTGIEVYFYDIIGRIAGQKTNLFCAYNVSLTGMPGYSASHQVQVGIKFGEWYKKGPTIYLAYYSGRHMFAEYFDQRLKTIGLGFTVDFF